ncbi:hypothetical protein QT327_19980 [Olivibacter sp. 47]|nr:hypothetical protein [Olivibacter sp. 47]MDM8176593.1 hypothetical protein [Olivibacter sp. 47]
MHDSGPKKRSSRLKSPEYRKAVGKKLREKRQDKGYSLSDIKDMTTIAPKTTLEMEKGLTTNIDYYVEYAKAVGYDLAPLTTTGIELIPLRELPPKKQERAFLTRKVRQHIIQSGFLSEGKTAQQIRTHLISINVIDGEKITTTDVSGVMRNFVLDETLEVVLKSAGKNIYAFKK